MANPETKMKEEAESHEDFVEADDEEDESDIKQENANGSKKESLSNILKDPTMLAALQAKIRSNNHAEVHAQFMESLPLPVKRRINALKNLQLASAKIEAEFYKEVHKLELQFFDRYRVQFDKRAKIVNSQYEPNDEECEWPSDDEDDEDGESAKGEKKAKMNDVKKAEGDSVDMKGIPDFWLTIIKNVELLSEMVQEHDEPILKHLTDIQVKLLEDPMGFLLEFHFSPNEYFTNSVLTKKYDFKCEPDDDDPFSFEGPEIVRCHGCKIDWKSGKNATQRIVKKKQKHKGHGGVRMVSKSVPTDSFFNFFDPPEVKDEDADDVTQHILTADFELGHFIRERIVPRAVLYYTGEALDDEDDEFMDDEDEEDDDEDDDDDDDEDDAPVVASRSKRRV